MLIKYLNSYFILASGILLMFIIYLTTMLPSQAMHDAGEFQTIVPTMDIAHPTGYPTYVILGKIIVILIPFGEIAWRVNLLSVIFATLSLIFLYLIVYSLTKDKIISVISFFILGLCYPFWEHAGIAGVDMLNIFFLMVLIFLSLNWDKTSKNILLFCFIFGIALGNHASLIYSIPGFIFLFIKTMKKEKINLFNMVKIFIYFILGLSIYIFLPIKQFIAKPLLDVHLTTFSGFINYISGSGFSSLMYRGNLYDIFVNAASSVKILIDNFSDAGVLIGLIGIIFALYKYRVFSINILITLISYIFFATNYPIADQSRYYLIFSAIFAIFIGLGMNEIIYEFKKIKKFRPLFKFLIIVLFVYLPFNLYISNYMRVDKSNNYIAEEYAKDIFSQVLPDSVLISWWNYSTPLWYRQRVLHEREDVLIINESPWEWKEYVDKNINGRPVYIVQREPSIYLNYKVIPEGRVYRVLP